MRYVVRFKIGNRWGAGSVYTLRDIAISLVGKYLLTNVELTTIVRLHVDDVFTNDDMMVTRLS